MTQSHEEAHEDAACIQAETVARSRSPRRRWRSRPDSLPCGSGGGDDASVTVNGDVAVAYVKRSTALSINPTDGTPFAPGGDLMLREKSSPSAPEHNLTAQFTQGQGDASDPEVSYDGKKLVFAMRCPTSNTSKIGDLPACTGRWNIWEYDMSAGLTSGTFRRLTASTDDDDVDPAYLPAGRGFVFSSNRQTKSKPQQALGQSYFALDEYERERVLNLHTMDADGGAITQISFNQSHDRNPVVRPTATSCSRAGARRPAQPLRHLPHQARRHRHVRALRRAEPRQQLPAIRATWTRRASYKGLRLVVADGAVADAGRRLAHVHRRRQLFRAQHAGQQQRAPRVGRPRSPPGAEPEPRPVDVRPDHLAPTRCGTAPTACCSPTGRARSRATACSSPAPR